MLHGPHPGCLLLDPVTGDGKVSIGVASLPCIACQADFTTNGRALMSERDMTSVDRKNKKEIYEL